MADADAGLRLALNLSLVFTELPLVARFGAAAARGFDAVEIQFPYDVPAGELAAAARAADVDIVLINVPAGDLMDGGPGIAACPGREAAYAQALDECETYVRALRPACINVLAGRGLPDAGRTRCLEIFMANLERTRERFAGLDVTTVFEAINTADVPGFLVDGTAVQRDIVRTLGGEHLLLQYDVYHMTRMGEDVTGFLRRHAREIGHVQFADAPGRGEPGTGDIDFAAVLAALAAGGYRGAVAAEYRPTGPSADSFGWLEHPAFAPLRARVSG